MTIFTIAVLLAGTISYASPIDLLPTAFAKEPKAPKISTECVAECLDVYIAAIGDCLLPFMELEDNGGATDKDVKDLKKCLKQALKDYNKCVKKTCKLKDFEP